MKNLILLLALFITACGDPRGTQIKFPLEVTGKRMFNEKCQLEFKNIENARYLNTYYSNYSTELCQRNIGDIIK